MRILDYWQNSPEALQVYDEERQVCDALKAALRQPFARSEALEVMERAQGNFLFEEHVDALVKKVLRNDPLDPQFRLYQIGFSGGWEFNPAGQRPKLQSILDEAIRRQDDAIVRKVRQMMQQLDHPPLPPPRPFEADFGPSTAGEEEDWDDGADPDGPMPPDLSPKDLAQFGEVLETLRGASDSEIRKLRKTRPPEIPEFVFDALVQMAQGGPPPPLPPLPSRPPKPPPPPPDPNQMNLF
jgi:hypothetical protein